MESAISQLYNLPSDRLEGEKFAEMLKKEIPAQRNPLNVLVILKVIEKVLKDVLTDDKVDAAFLKDFAGHAKDNKLLVSGASLTSQEFGGTYDFSQDKEWTTLQEMIKNLTEKKILRQEELKSKLVKESGKVKVVVKL